MVEPLPMGAFDPLEDSDDDIDFQIQRQLLNRRLTTAIGGLTALQQISVNGPNANSNQGRGRKRKRGPPAKKVSHIWYCLAEGATVPNLKKKESCPIHQAQTEAGYGYPPSCVSQEGISMVQLELELDEVQFKEDIWELFPILRRSPFNIYKRDKQKKLVLINVKTPKELKNERYRSTIFIRPSSAFHSALAPASTSATTAALAPASTSATTAALAPASTSATTLALARASTSASTSSATTSVPTTSVPTIPFVSYA
nr:uncharacterized protein LOC129270318 [Lytechinus pictus]